MSILIKNALIYDGRGQPPFQKDILIRGNQISALGEFNKSKAEEVIDAKGNIVLPGFIDTNSRLDHNLQIFTNPYHQNFLKQGITTVIGGNGGASLSPFSNNTLKEIEKWGSEPSSKINADWETFSDLFTCLKRMGLGINFGSLVGHASIKRILTDNEPRDLTEKELKLFKKILKKSLKEGALGLSLSFRGFSSKTPKREIEDLVKTATEEGKIYTTDLKNPEDAPLESLNEIINLAQAANPNIQINSLAPPKSVSSKYKKIKERVEKETPEERLNFDCHPYPYTKIPIHQLLPKWLQSPDLEDMIRSVTSGRYDKEITEHLKKHVRKEIIISEISKDLKFLENKKIKDISQNRSQSQAETLLEIMKESSLKAVCLFGNVDKEILEELILSNPSIIASGGIDFKLRHKPFLKFINWITEETSLPLEKAIMKTSSLPALKFGIKKRGVIKENYYADLILIKNGSVSTVVVNGNLVFHEGEIKERQAGKIIK